MTPKKLPSRSKSEPHGTEKLHLCNSADDEILIPELEEAMLTFTPREWQPKEIAIMKKYYGKVPQKLLLKHLPGKTKAAIRSKAQGMGLATPQGGRA